MCAPKQRVEVIGCIFARLRNGSARLVVITEVNRVNGAEEGAIKRPLFEQWHGLVEVLPAAEVQRRLKCKAC